MRLPFPSEPTRHFGRRWLVLPGQAGFWNDHTGCDWSKNYGTPIPVSDSGKVIGNYFTNLKGWQLVVQNTRTGVITRYHMLNERSPKAHGSSVREGETIGRVGSSGTASTGPHLHFEVWKNGVPVDPYKYITGSSAGGGSTPIGNDMPLDQNDLNKIVAAVWGYEIKRSSGNVSAIQELANVRTDTSSLRSAVGDLPTDVWKVAVQRTAGPVSALQELANASTAAQSVAAREPGAVASIDYDKLAEAIVAKLPKAEAPLTKTDVVDAIKSVVFKAE